MNDSAKRQTRLGLLNWASLFTKERNFKNYNYENA
jgi:hypothetical protein